MKRFFCFLKKELRKNFSIKAGVYISKKKKKKKKKRLVHIAFGKSISDCDCFDKIWSLFQKNGKKENFSLRVTKLSILDL